MQPNLRKGNRLLKVNVKTPTDTNITEILRKHMLEQKPG